MKLFDRFTKKHKESSPQMDENTHQIKNTADMFAEIVRESQNTGRLHDDIVRHVPELMVESDRVAHDICNAFIQYDKENNRHSNLVSYFTWAIFAGMGAVVLWDQNWSLLKQKGIFESLVEPQGFTEMDEYVCKLIGEKPSSTELQPFQEDLHKVGGMLLKYFDDMSEENIINLLLNAMKAAYQFGIVYEMDRLKYPTDMNDNLSEDITYDINNIDDYHLEQFTVTIKKILDSHEPVSGVEQINSIGKLAFYIYQYIQQITKYLMPITTVKDELPKILRFLSVQKIVSDKKTSELDVGTVLELFNNVIKQSEEKYIDCNLQLDDEFRDNVIMLEASCSLDNTRNQLMKDIRFNLNIFAGHLEKFEKIYYPWQYNSINSTPVTAFDSIKFADIIDKNASYKDIGPNIDIQKIVHASFYHVYTYQDFSTDNSVMEFIDWLALVFFNVRLYAMSNLPKKTIPVFLDEYQQSMTQLLKSGCFVEVEIDDNWQTSKKEQTVQAFLDRAKAIENSFMTDYELLSVIETFYFLIKHDHGKDNFINAREIPIIVDDIFKAFEDKMKIKRYINHLMESMMEYTGIPLKKDEDSIEEADVLLPDAKQNSAEAVQMVSDNDEVFISDNSNNQQPLCEEDKEPIHGDQISPSCIYITPSDKKQINHPDNEVYIHEETQRRSGDYEQHAEVNNQDNVLFCRKCGTQLISDSLFCHRCGTKVIHLKQ